MKTDIIFLFFIRETTMLSYFCFLIMSITSSSQVCKFDKDKDISLCMLPTANYYLNNNNKSFPCYLADSSFYPAIEITIYYEQTKEFIHFIEGQIKDEFQKSGSFTDSEIKKIIELMKKTHPHNIRLLHEFIDLAIIDDNNANMYRKGIAYCDYYVRKFFSHKNQLAEFDNKYAYNLCLTYFELNQLSKYGSPYSLQLDVSDTNKVIYNKIGLSDELPEITFSNNYKLVTYTLKNPQKSIEIYENPYKPLSSFYQPFYYSYKKMANEKNFSDRLGLIIDAHNFVQSEVSNFISNPIKEMEVEIVAGKPIQVLWSETSYSIFGKKRKFIYVNQDQIDKIIGPSNNWGKIISYVGKIGTSVSECYILFNYGISLQSFIYFQIPYNINRLKYFTFRKFCS